MYHKSFSQKTYVQFLLLFTSFRRFLPLSRFRFRATSNRPSSCPPGGCQPTVPIEDAQNSRGWGGNCDSILFTTSFIPYFLNQTTSVVRSIPRKSTSLPHWIVYEWCNEVRHFFSSVATEVVLFNEMRWKWGFGVFGFRPFGAIVWQGVSCPPG